MPQDQDSNGASLADQKVGHEIEKLKLESARLRESAWRSPTTLVAAGGLLLSLLGNWIQYQTLLGKQTELSQAQAKIDAAAEDVRQRRAARETKRRELDLRMSQFDRELKAAELEFRRGAVGLNLARAEEKPEALRIMQAAAAEREKILAQKKLLQDKIDALPTD